VFVFILGCLTFFLTNYFLFCLAVLLILRHNGPNCYKTAKHFYSNADAAMLSGIMHSTVMSTFIMLSEHYIIMLSGIMVNGITLSNIFGDCEVSLCQVKSMVVRGHIHKTVISSLLKNEANKLEYYITLGQKGLPVKNAPAYWAHS
jgi:hypothetical protein